MGTTKLRSLTVLLRVCSLTSPGQCTNKVWRARKGAKEAAARLYPLISGGWDINRGPSFELSPSPTATGQQE